jgi:integrase
MNIFEQYEKRLERRQRKPSTIKNFRLATKDFLTHLDGQDPLTVTEEVIEEWAYSNHYAVSTRISHLSQMASVYKYARGKGWIDQNPFMDVAWPVRRDSEPQILSGEKLLWIRERCLTGRQQLIFHLYAYTGLRQFEGRTLHSDQIRETDDGWQLNITGKGGKLRYVPVHPRLLPMLRNSKGWVFPSPRSDKPMSATMLYNDLQDMWPDAPEGQAFHSFRRTVTSSLIHNGAKAEARHKILGWQPKTIEEKHYANIAPADLHEAILKLYLDSPALGLYPPST